MSQNEFLKRFLITCCVLQVFALSCSHSRLLFNYANNNNLWMFEHRYSACLTLAIVVNSVIAYYTYLFYKHIYRIK